MITILNEPAVVFIGAKGLAIQALRDTKVDELKFKDTIGTVDTFTSGALIGLGEAPLDTMDEVGVDISAKPSPELDMKKLKGTPIPGGPNI